jgi:hypothetical protein
VFRFNNYKSSKVIQFILLLYYVICYAQEYSTALLHGTNQPAIQLTKILNSHLKIWIVTWKLTKNMPLRYQKRYISMYKLALSWKKHPALLSGLGGSPPPPPPTCNSISDKMRCDLKISHREIMKFLSHFVHFSSIKSTCYIVKKCQQNRMLAMFNYVTILSGRLWHAWSMLSLTMLACPCQFCSLEAANCTM